MKFGAYMFSTDYSIRPDDLARLLEARGFESMWVPEHTHIPAARQTPFPGGGDLPEMYWHTYDPFVALTAAAAATTSLKLGTSICLMIERDPIITAKEVASLDMLSGGRFIFGIGGGWNAEEMGHHGTRYRSRWRLLRERILAMKEIWTKDEPEFHGEFVNFDKIWSYPKPVQKPHPPIIMGGDGATTFDRIVEFCDGWMPISGRASQGPSLSEKIATLKRQAEGAGRDPASISITSFGTRPDPDVIQRMETEGVDRVIFSLPSEKREAVLPIIDRCAKLI
ncbi:MAG: TIGR03619 family F420-dependent LLM class oxidoreductase [Dehalococcoidia bacterium]|jgi:probable F420-dependent oxidoreductase|nr:TIGR03619 family F420-dependent LLM class oxidoreductase [Dehalococcoidia bacterium]